ncbi:cupredoxin domain-containing protein [Nocardia rhizosphaerihabitans]|uniref:cupredoxin domain-containing protein n=1 Tax=Nocardia rhizosphaerihabitans TaxID=1691570 RepID=UPI00366EEBB6
MQKQSRRIARIAVGVPFALAVSLSGVDAHAQDSNRITVIETEYSITVSRPNVRAGTYTLDVRNNGGTRHDLVIAGPGVDSRTPVLEGGAGAELKVTLKPGTYALWCSVGKHHSLGMRSSISVA